MVSGLVAKSCPTLCNTMDCILPSSSVHGIYQARILEWVAVCFTEYLPHPGSNPVSGIAGRLLHCRLILYKLSHQGRLINQLISLAALALYCCTWALPGVRSRGYSPATLCGLLIPVTSVAAAHGLSRSLAYGTLVP